MILNPSFPKNKINYTFKPEDRVYVPYLIESDLFSDAEFYPLACDQAYNTRSKARSHFWFREKGNKVEIREMTVEEFLKDHDWKGMNPFETLNKIEFLTKYKEKYPEIGNVKS